jgi:hypothetical protein
MVSISARISNGLAKLLEGVLSFGCRTAHLSFHACNFRFKVDEFEIGPVCALLVKSMS